MTTIHADTPLPASICWMPAGTHMLNAGTVDGTGFMGNVICDAQAAQAVKASFDAIQRSGQRVWLDLNHDDGAAAAWVKGFHWDPRKGIIAQLEWTPSGENALQAKEYYSFSPAFEANRTTGRVEGLIKGRAAGGLVNSPAFGSAMPALVAARLQASMVKASLDLSTFTAEDADDFLAQVAGQIDISDREAIHALTELKDALDHGRTQHRIQK